MSPLAGPMEEARASVVIVSGAGRSGTSTVAGVLKQLGYYVPQPEVSADESNPRGFFEPAWVVDFHKRVLREIDVRTQDSRPVAAELATGLSTHAEHAEELRSWLAHQQREAPRLVIKDPRTVWVADLWLAVASSLRIDATFLTMLRHPAEVVGSRDMHYLNELPTDVRQSRETTNAAGWINVNLVNELRTRQNRRSFVRYDKLLDDWRGTMLAASEQLGLSLPVELTSPEASRVDEFIDPSLYRARAAWDNVEIPDDLRELAEGLWEALGALADKPHDPDATARVDELRVAYNSMHARAVAFARHHTLSEVTNARRVLRTRLDRQHRKHVEDVRQQVRQRMLDRQPEGPARRSIPSRARGVVRRLLDLRSRRGA